MEWYLVALELKPRYDQVDPTPRMAGGSAGNLRSLDTGTVGIVAIRIERELQV